MIAFSCRHCHTVLEAADEKAGEEFCCAACGHTTQVPFVIPTDDESVDPQAQTVTLAELQALRQARQAKK